MPPQGTERERAPLAESVRRGNADGYHRPINAGRARYSAERVVLQQQGWNRGCEGCIRPCMTGIECFFICKEDETHAAYSEG